MAVGKKLEELLKLREMNVNQLSLYTGINPQTMYSIIKRDNMKVNLDDLQKIAKFLNVPLEYFLSSDIITECENKTEKLAKVIKESGLTYAELSEKCGISKSALQRYANGETPNIPLNRVEAIAKALNIDALALFGWEIPAQKEEIPANNNLIIGEQMNDLSIRENIKNNLNKYLKIRGISKKEFAQKLGVGPSSVSNWLSGVNAPDIDLIAEICKVLNISIYELLGYSEEAQPRKEPPTEIQQIYDELPPEGRHSLKLFARALLEDSKK